MTTQWAGQGGAAASPPAGPSDLRASDAERQQVVDALRGHTGAGRLQLDEFEERSGLAFAARTRGDLETLLVDLPSPGPWGDGTRRTAPPRPADHAPSSRPLPVWPAPVGQGPPAHRGRSSCGGGPAVGHHQRTGRIGRSAFLYVAAMVTLVWALTGAHIGNFWPVWVIGPWGLSVLFGRGWRSGHRRPIPSGDL